MTDLELLKLAAMASGFVNWTWRGESLFVETGHSRGNTGYHWNPLKDDGDALRLAVKLNLGISIPVHKTIRADVVCFLDSSVSVREEGSDPYAATRRAIVRAAAAIGKDMK